MEVKTFRAKSLQDALRAIRTQLGPDAAVLHTKEIKPRLLGLFGGIPEIEVTASAGVKVPRRLPTYASTTRSRDFTTPHASPHRIQPAHQQDFRTQFRNALKTNGDCPSMISEMSQQSPLTPQRELPATLFHLFTDLIDAEVSEELTREFIDRVLSSHEYSPLDDAACIKDRIAHLLENEISTTGPIQLTTNSRRLVALVGPTGVGKTTTIAKLAANYHLREKKRVGLITVDTYRIAAVEQLKTYADIIDLPMEVVSTPHEMRGAVERLADFDLVLMDTAGRSPRDKVKIEELRSLLSVAQADEVHLVLSSVAGTASLKKTAEHFSQVGITSLLFTKLDEATGLGNLIPLLRASRLPLSYVTNGQNVPDDIEPADQRKLARTVLGMEHHA